MIFGIQRFPETPELKKAKNQKQYGWNEKALIRHMIFCEQGSSLPDKKNQTIDEKWKHYKHNYSPKHKLSFRLVFDQKSD